MSKRLRILQSPKIAEKKRKKRIYKALIYFVSIVVLLVVILLFLRLNFLQIDNVSIMGASTINNVEMEKKINESLVGNYIGLIPKTNIFFYPKNAIKEELKNNFKAIQELSIKIKGMNTILVDLKEKDPTSLVCEGFPEDKGENESCYFIDKAGYIYAKAPQFSNGVYTRYYTGAKVEENILGTNFIDQKTFTELENFISIIKKSKLIPTGILIGENGEYEMYIKNIDESIMTVYFDNRFPFDKTATNLIAFIEDAKLKKKSASTTPIFDSINLRFGNNIFYVPK